MASRGPLTGIENALKSLSVEQLKTLLVVLCLNLAEFLSPCVHDACRAYLRALFHRWKGARSSI
jgi:hypothetical protein